MTTLIKASLILLAIASTSFAEEGHHHDKPIPGPKGGRVLEVPGGRHAEFFVQPDRKVSVIFYDAEMKPTAPGEQTVKVIAEAPSGKVSLDFEKTADAFVSSNALPESDGYRIVLQIKPASDGKAQNFRIDYHTEICDECKHPEYACTCPDHKGHEH
jgi:hypothetical protein